MTVPRPGWRSVLKIRSQPTVWETACKLLENATLWWRPIPNASSSLLVSATTEEDCLTLVCQKHKCIKHVFIPAITSAQSAKLCQQQPSHSCQRCACTPHVRRLLGHSTVACLAS